jgi:hypothetical protein
LQAREPGIPVKAISGIAHQIHHFHHHHHKGGSSSHSGILSEIGDLFSSPPQQDYPQQTPGLQSRASIPIGEIARLAHKFHGFHPHHHEAGSSSHSEVLSTINDVISPALDIPGLSSRETKPKQSDLHAHMTKGLSKDQLKNLSTFMPGLVKALSSREMKHPTGASHDHKGRPKLSSAQLAVLSEFMPGLAKELSLNSREPFDDIIERRALLLVFFGFVADGSFF